MRLTSAGWRASRRLAVGALCLCALPRQGHAQDAASILATLGKFVSGFDAGVVFVAPAGFIHSDVLAERGELQQVGIALRNPEVGITVGFDVLTGFQAKEESLDLRAAVTALPTISTFHVTRLRDIRGVTPSATFGFGVGLSQLQDARATLPQAAGADRTVKLGGTGYHAGASAAFGASVGSVGVYVENSFRYTRFPSLDWIDDKSIAPPAGWPTSMDFWTGTVRVGVGIGAP
jgi:hypothetical protein